MHGYPSVGEVPSATNVDINLVYFELFQFNSYVLFIKMISVRNVENMSKILGK